MKKIEKYLKSECNTLLKVEPTMCETNLYSKMRYFNEITTDSRAINIFLCVAKNKKRNVDELIEETKLKASDVFFLVEKLEKGNFIERNPGLSSQQFKLGFNGQLFAEQLKEEYVELKEILGEKSLIEPL